MRWDCAKALFQRHKVTPVLHVSTCESDLFKEISCSLEWYLKASVLDFNVSKDA